MNKAIDSRDATCGSGVVAISIDARAYQALALWIWWFEEGRGCRVVLDSHGLSECFFCGEQFNSMDEKHAHGCIYEQAKALVEACR